MEEVTHEDFLNVTINHADNEKGSDSMAEKVELTEQDYAENALLNDAIAYAVLMHRPDLRKGTTMPYIVHPLEVMHILEVMTGDKHLMAAGVLHDVVEDTDATIENVYAKFGEDIGALVAGHTEMHKDDPWEKRKQEAYAYELNGEMYVYTAEEFYKLR